MLFVNQPKNETFSEHICQHVAIIMDGNGRWAKKRGKVRAFGHKAGARSVRRAISFAVHKGIDTLTLYAFSSENWHRPEHEIRALMELFAWTLHSGVKHLHYYNICLRVIGDISRFSIRLQNLIRKAEEITLKNTGLRLNIAANYGGRWDITRGAQRLAEQVHRGLLKPDQIDENMFNKFICMSELTPVDLVIRTGGDHRISNFLLWQIAYAELYFTDILWPDFNKKDFEDALHVFSNRKRRFGGV